MTPLRSRRLPQLTSKPSCAYSPLGVDAASTISVGAAFRCLQVGLGFAGGLVVPGGVGRRYELAVPDGAGRRYELAAPGRQAVRTGSAGASALVVPGGAGRRYELAVPDGAGRRYELAALGQQMRRGAQSAVGDRCGGDAGAGEGALGDA